MNLMNTSTSEFDSTGPRTAIPFSGNSQNGLDVAEINVYRTATSHRNPGRPVMSRKDQSHIEILISLKPGQKTDGCLVCCAAPSCCPFCTLCCPCCGESEYVAKKRSASTYIYLRENSIEWNEPTVILQSARGVCCGMDPCLFNVSDNVQVLYYDDEVFETVTDQTRCCNECLTCFFGGRGERIRMDGPVLCFCCQRTTISCCFVPVVCSKSLCCPCMLRYEIYLDDAQQALFEIKKAREAALNSDLHAWTTTAIGGKNMSR